MLDDLDRTIIGILVEDARISLKDLANQVGLSSPSTAERLRRLEERKVIRSFTVDVDPVALGYNLTAVVRVRPLPGMLHIVEKLIQETPEITECDKVTGDDCFIGKLQFRTMEQLDMILDRLAERAETNTSIVKSSPVRRRLPPLS
ncbi:Lrp/AsnC family transcriptional regulator [Phyllobacterium endophyticum]|jgi:Lrp/AsnC family leucine-responsive transcriptional regulator|uniref:AsnC family transcriptional regulator n=1 Tax=Phyllobacterium endophyticum TaxID=1149773 RepID=A0A2P7B168_9HYPH|nr:Lrp/AsnC family transcriptional regulator [Phyllobacterium endophyticum]MBB3237738.1 Lrp/AsnC family leucine-responsive transcriptional regulator [Phyllobacterium endophyticum]PSH60191.1 AsnC family transcriptional regulator [Phyllobacterium endophyticum]TXR48649.1 Lrp/AsnC family transcriptional regulator [Phyllobacterium endophyticum]TYR42360.1 Lrp/AsnC family transcriptional regulator [Phyllobacterium endophyticum]